MALFRMECLEISRSKVFSRPYEKYIKTESRKSSLEKDENPPLSLDTPLSFLQTNMCWEDIAPVFMLCGHNGPEQILGERPCNQDPCVTGGTPDKNYLGSTRKRQPCDDCIADGTWKLKEGSSTSWEKA